MNGATSDALARGVGAEYLVTARVTRRAFYWRKIRANDVTLPASVVTAPV